MKKTATLLTLVVLFSVVQAQNEWTVIHPYPTANDLLDACFVSEQEGWAVGTNGLIMHTLDGGNLWEIQHEQPQESFWGVFFINELEGWVVGWSKIYHTDDGGLSWGKQLFPSVMGDLTDVFFINPDTGWIVGTYKIVLLTTDGGENWSRIMNQISEDKCFYSVKFTDALHGCAVGGLMSFSDEGFIMVTDDGGYTWTETSPAESHHFETVIFLDSVTGWVCGRHGDLFKTTDRGMTWEDKRFSYDNYEDIYFFCDSNGMLLTGNQVILTTNGGEDWDSVLYVNLGGLPSFCPSGENQGWTVGFGGSLNKTCDGGYTWQGMNHGILEPINNIGMFNALQGVALHGSAYPGGDLLVTQDGGYYWSKDTVVTNGPFYNIFVRESTCYLLNRNAQLMKSTNSGQDWEMYEVPANSNQYRNMQFVDDNTGYLSGYPGYVFKTTDGGQTWEDKSIPGDVNIWDMFFLDENHGWIIDHLHKHIIRTNNGGDTWVTTMLDDQGLYQPRNVNFTSESTGYVVTDDGILFNTLDGGDSWAPIYIFSNSAYDIYFTSPTEGWCITFMGIQHTLNGGFSWGEKERFGTNHVSGTFFIDKDQGWLYGSNGLVAIYQGTVGFQEESVNSSQYLTIYPNPVTDELNVQTSDSKLVINDIQVFNLQAQSVLHFSGLSVDNTFTINVASLKSGVYILKADIGGSQKLMKFVKH